MSETIKIIPRTIYKYPLTDVMTAHDVPLDAKLLSMQWDDKEGAPCIWFLVHPDNEKEERIFLIYGTGHAIPYGIDYINTVIDSRADFVWHVFEMRREENHE